MNENKILTNITIIHHIFDMLFKLSIIAINGYGIYRALLWIGAI